MTRSSTRCSAAGTAIMRLFVKLGRSAVPGLREAAEIQAGGRDPHVGEPDLVRALQPGHQEHVDRQQVVDGGDHQDPVQDEAQPAFRPMLVPPASDGRGVCRLCDVAQLATSCRRLQTRYGTMTTATRTSITIATAAPRANWLSLNAVCHMKVAGTSVAKAGPFGDIATVRS